MFAATPVANSHKRQELSISPNATRSNSNHGFKAAFQRCPLCGTAFAGTPFADEIARRQHMDSCLDEFHLLPSKFHQRNSPATVSSSNSEEKRKIRFAPAESVLVFSYPSTEIMPRHKRLLTSPGEKMMKRKDRNRNETLRLPPEIWSLVISFIKELQDVRACSRTLRAICEMEALNRIAPRLWMRVVVNDKHRIRIKDSLLTNRRSYFATDFLISKADSVKFEVIPCINVSLDGRIRAHLIFVRNNCNYKEFANEWERVTGINSDRAMLATCNRHRIGRCLGPSDFPNIRSLRTSGIFAFEKLPPLSPMHTRITINWRGIFRNVAYFGIPLMVIVPFGSSRDDIHVAVQSRIAQYIRSTNQTSKRAPYSLRVNPAEGSVDFGEYGLQENMVVLPRDGEKVLESELCLIADFGGRALDMINFDFFPQELVLSNDQRVFASMGMLIEALVERDCGVRIMH